MRGSVCQVNCRFDIFQISVNCCCGLHWRVSGSHSVSNGKTGIDLITLICNSRNVKPQLTHHKSQAPGATMKVTHKINMLVHLDYSPRNRWRTHAAPFWLIFTFSKSRAILSVTDSLYVAPINSYFLTCVERRDSPPRTIVGAGRLTGLHLLSGGAFCCLKDRLHQSEKKHREAKQKRNL